MFWVNKGSSKGAVLVEVLFTSLVWGVLIASAHFVVIRFWNDRLTQLDRTRLEYRGIFP